MRTTIRRALGALAGGLVAGMLAMPAAQAQEIRGFSNADGSVTCDYGTLDGQTYIECLSPGARATRSECNPPNELVPHVRYFAGQGTAGCYNQGLTSTSFNRLGAGEIFRYREVTVVPDHKGGLHLFNGATYAGYAGKTAVEGTSNLTALSSRLL